MAIDPTQVTTVNAEQLPILPLQNDSIIVHSIDGILYQGTVSEIQALLNIVAYKPYEVKWLNVTDLYISENFDVNGLGLVDGDWATWQIMNGNNGTTNFDGAVALGYGATYNSMKQQVGENTKAIIKTNIPALDFVAPVSNADNGGGTHDYIMATNTEPAGTKTYVSSVNSPSPATPISIMQKSYVQLFIMKLP